MKHLLCAVAAFGTISFAPLPASAADLGGYEERETYVERPARIGRHDAQPRLGTRQCCFDLGAAHDERKLAERISLRLIASEMRAERHARMEERAARLPVLMAIPMMMFILPCLLMIIGTPVVLRMIDAFKNLHIGGFSGIH